MDLIKSILEQEDQGIDPRYMRFSKESHYVFQQLSRDCLGCGRQFTYWYSKMQHVGSSGKQACYSSGAGNFEAKLWNVHYDLTRKVSKIRKRTGKFHTVIDRMIGITQNTDMTDFSQLPLSLKASMPPPDYFDGWTVVNPADVERVD